MSKSLVRLILEYCSSERSRYTNVSARKIEQIQRWAKKMVEKCQDVSYSERLRIIGIPAFQFRRFTADMIQVYKILDEYEDIDTE